MLNQYERTVEEHTLISLLYPLAGINLNDWKEEAKEKISLLIARAENQLMILLNKENAEAKAKKEVENRMKAEAEAKKDRENRMKAEAEAKKEV